MKSKEYAGRRLLTAFLRAPFDFKRKSKMVPLLLKFLRKAHKFLLNLDEIFVIIILVICTNMIVFICISILPMKILEVLYDYGTRQSKMV